MEQVQWRPETIQKTGLVRKTLGVGETDQLGIMNYEL